MSYENTSSLDQTLEALRAVGEHTRLRILLLCAHGELTVGDLTQILDQSQPRVSRHLKLMHEAGVLERHQEGSQVWFRAVTSGVLASLVRGMVDQISVDDPDHAQDLDKLRQVTKSWEVRARSYFRKHYADWDQLRSDLIDEDAIDAAIKQRFSELGAKTLLDIGTGTGLVLRLLGSQLENAVGMDNSRDMLLAARAAIHKEKLPHCQLRHGEMRYLPFEDDSFDAVSLHLSLHYAEDPKEVLQECARVTGTGGWILLVDFASHDQRQLMSQHGHRWPGFNDNQIQEWLTGVGYSNFESQTFTSGSPNVVFWLACLGERTR